VLYFLKGDSMFNLIKLRHLFKSLGRDILVLFYACRHQAAPSWVRFSALALLIYVVSPVDFITDLVPLLGLADDFALVALGVPWLLKQMPDHVLQEGKERAARRFGQRSARSNAGSQGTDQPPS
jgi:uncharacterized membrane protein YkvA (DUF1232 family)